MEEGYDLYIIMRNYKVKFIVSIIVIMLSMLVIMTRTSKSFQVDSESLIVDPMLATINNCKWNESNWALGFLKPINGLENGHLYPNIIEYDNKLKQTYSFIEYKSQIGIQGIIFNWIAGISKNINIIIILRWICCFLFVVVALLIALQLKKRYGILLPLVFYGVVILSKWTTDFAPNLYWVMFTWFVPILLGLLCVNYEKKRTFIYPLFFVAIFFKSLCGYEYLSTIMITAEMFLIVEFLVCKERRKDTFKSIIISGLCMFLGFLTVLIIHSVILGEGDLVHGIEIFIHDLVGRRTFGNASDYSIEYRKSLNASVMEVLGLYFNNDFYGNIMKWLFAVALICLIFRQFVEKKDCRRLFALLLLSFISVTSWLILAKGHSYIHTHMNFVLFDLGYSWVSIYCILFFIACHLKNNKIERILMP